MTLREKYSQNFISNTFAVGIHRAVGVTRGIIIIVTPDAPKHPSGIRKPVGQPFGDWSPIQTKRVILPGDSEPIDVTAFLLNPGDLGSLEAILLDLKIKKADVYLIDEIEIIDNY